MGKDSHFSEEQVEKISNLLGYSIAAHYDDQILKHGKADNYLGLIREPGYVYLMPVFDLLPSEEVDFISLMINKTKAIACARGAKFSTKNGDKTLEILVLDSYRARVFVYPIEISPDGVVSYKEGDPHVTDLLPGQFYPYRNVWDRSRNILSIDDRVLTGEKFSVFMTTLGDAGHTLDYSKDWQRLVFD